MYLWFTTEIIFYNCVNLDIIINLEKSGLKPKQRVKYFGMLIKAAQENVFPTDSYIGKFKVVSAHFLDLSHPTKFWLWILSHMVSLERLVLCRCSIMSSLQ